MRAVLAVIIAGPAWGLEICEETGLGTGKVYPALNRLLKDGLILDRWEEQEDGPPRRYYDLAYPVFWYQVNGFLLQETRREQAEVLASAGRLSWRRYFRFRRHRS